MNGPELRTDMVLVYVFRRAHETGEVSLLQVRRTREPFAGTWQTVAGSIERGERAVAAAARELREEIALDVRTPACLGFWRLDRVRPFYMPAFKGSARDAVILAPSFAAEAAPSWSARLNDEHDASRWVGASEVRASFMWPGQVEAIGEVLGWLAEATPARAHLRIDPGSIEVAPGEPGASGADARVDRD